MLVFATAFYFVFSHRPYIDPAANQIPCLQSFIEMVDVRDIYGDVRENFVDPIPVPGLPRRWGRERRDHAPERETAPLIVSPSAGYESGDDGGVARDGVGVARSDRLGSGEESLVMFGMQDGGVVSLDHTHSSLTPPSECSTDNDQEVRERKGRSDRTF